MNATVLSVSQLNTYLKSVFEGDPNLNVFIEGEISNFKNHYSSGHLYFSLKDEKSVLKCVMFRRYAECLKFVPSDGMRVICRGRVAVYERDGLYQLYAEDMQPTGIGALSIAYEQLKNKLEKEGLFDISTKRPLPESPSRVAILTASTGAAIHDMLSIAARRNPFAEIVLCPVTVQGEYAAESMVKMLDRVYSAPDIDVIIIGRGGGSFEDLYCFNDEELVRKIYESPVPVVSAVGHESDFTLCDFVADVRAATPSAAAELVFPDMTDSLVKVSYLKNRISFLCRQILDNCSERYDKCTDSELYNPEKFISEKEAMYTESVRKLLSTAKLKFAEKQSRFQTSLSKLEALNPASIMIRGYSTVLADGKIINNSASLKVGDEVQIKFGYGSANATVTDIKKEK